MKILSLKLLWSYIYTYYLSAIQIRFNLIENGKLFLFSILSIYNTTRIPEMLAHFYNLNKMKTKRLLNHMSHYFIHNRT